MNRTIIALTALCLALTSCNKADESGAALAKPAQPVAATAAPVGKDWVSTVGLTPDGGYVMGNPGAPVKLIEYGALSCPHCAHFAKDSHDELRAMIATGKLSYELRTFLIHPQIDLPASLLAPCNGPATFFPIADQLFARQDDWMGPDKFKLLTPEVQKGWAGLSPNQLAADVAGRLGLISFVGVRGVSAEKAKACLADKAGVDRLQKIMNSANDQYHITGTPTFILNGQTVADVNDWAALKPRVKAALGG
jgi:protein-disulfide isomerase